MLDTVFPPEPRRGGHACTKGLLGVEDAQDKAEDKGVCAGYAEVYGDEYRAWRIEDLQRGITVAFYAQNRRHTKRENKGKQIDTHRHNSRGYTEPKRRLQSPGDKVCPP